jgi:hypothetical protein
MAALLIDTLAVFIWTLHSPMRSVGMGWIVGASIAAHKREISL